MNERRKMLATENITDTVVLRVTTTDGSTNVGIEMVVTNGDIVYSVTTDSQGKVELTGLSGGCTINCETHEINVTEFYATKNMTVDILAYINTFPIGEVRNYNYTASVQQVELIPGTYRLLCWGAQGGSNATASSYGITAKAGGKGGYSEGVLTLTSKTTVRIYVGGAGSSSAGGFNGGGSTSGSASYNSGNEQGVSRMGGGGGATDIRLSDGALLSRMIVAGGGSGGAMCYKKATTTNTITDKATSSFVENFYSNHYVVINYPVTEGRTYTIVNNTSTTSSKWGKENTRANIYFTAYTHTEYDSTDRIGSTSYCYSGNSLDVTVPSGAHYICINHWASEDGDLSGDFSVNVKIQHSETSTTTSNDSQVGFVGGGTNGGGYSSTYQGKQNGAGSGGSFGQGANQTVTNYRYCSGAGGGGWYGGGGGQYSDSSMTTCRYSGGGSGWVNIAANASYRPSGYTGLQLDSGTTYAGNTSFPSVTGGTETGHSGNGYARIMRILS